MLKEYCKMQELSFRLEIEVWEIDKTCWDCPTIFEFRDAEGNHYYFRLNYGYAILVCEDTDETLVLDVMEGFEGECDFKDLQRWALNKGIRINNNC